MYLLDTDTLSNLLRRSPSATLVVKLASVPVGEQFTSSITLGELVFGAHRDRGRATYLLQRLEEVLPPDRPILPFDAPAARRYGELNSNARVRPSGRPTRASRPSHWPTA